MKRLSHRFALLAVLLLVPVALVIGAEQLKPQGWVFPTVKLQAVPAAAVDVDLCGAYGAGASHLGHFLVTGLRSSAVSIAVRPCRSSRP